MIRKPESVKNVETPRKPPPQAAVVEREHREDGERADAVESRLVATVPFRPPSSDHRVARSRHAPWPNGAISASCGG